MFRFRALATALIVFALSLTAFLAYDAAREGPADPATASHAGGMDLMSIDMDPSNTPANTATELGTRQDCASVIENNTLDADEDTTDTLSVDISATNIPASNPMAAFAFDLTYPTDLNVTQRNANFLLNSTPGSSLFDASDTLPDTNGVYSASTADLSEFYETGTGVLQRLGLSTVPAAGNGVFPLDLPIAAHVDPFNDTFAPDATETADVAINTNCPLPPVDIELVSLSLVSVSGPSAAVGTDFSLEVTATALNNGPNPADIRIDVGLAGPVDCTLTPPANQTQDFLNVPPTEQRISVQAFTANCADPSLHQFAATGSVSVTGLAEETLPANNGPLNDTEDVAITADADPKLPVVTVDSPTDAATGAPFNVTVTANLHNNGPFGPISMDTSFDLPMPPGCSRTPDSPQAVENTSLPVSAPVPVAAAWIVSCTTTGLKTFTGTATTVLDHLHVTDTNLGNNSAQGQDTTDTSLGQADVKVTSVTLSSPPSAAVNANFPVSVSTLVHNNGPFAPVNADVNLTLNLPPDCFTPVTSIDFQDANLGPSIAAQLPDVTFYVGCTTHSFHDITATATIAVDDALAGDPNPGNNSSSTLPATTAVIRTADFKTMTVTVSSPASATVGTPFNVDVDAAVHNNGPDAGPVDVEVALGLPPDCSTAPNPSTVSVLVPVSATTAVPTQTFSVTCTSESMHSFDAAVLLNTPLHVIDPNGANNEATSLASTTAVFAQSDLKVASVSVQLPPSPQTDVPFNVTAATTLHNNGPFGPTNADLLVTLSLPADCTTPDANPASLEDTSLVVSAATPVPQVWSVTCTAQSTHSFSATSAVSVDQLHVQDSVAANDSLASAAANTPIVAAADGKIVTAQIIDPPTFISSNTTVPITVRKTLHNNGPFGPTSFSLTKSSAPVAGCTVTPPATSNHNLGVSAMTILDEIWTINCLPGTYIFSFTNTLSPTALHVADPTPGNSSAVTVFSVTVDTDGDGIPDDVENACGSNPGSGTSIPERIDGVFSGTDDDGDTQVDELLPGGASSFDCDRDGYRGSTEANVYTPDVRGDQDPCGTNSSPPTVPPSPIGWPSDLVPGGIPDSTNRITILDVTSFLGPIRYFNTNVGDHPGDVRWDLVPGAGLFPFTINITDLNDVIILRPPMLGGVRSFNGPACPSPP